MPEPSPSPTGLPAYQGYEYQILVTVWLALELMLDEAKGCESVEVEPASEEDARAELHVDPEAADASLRGPGRRELQIQVKLRSEALSATAFKTLLSPAKASKGKKGPPPRLRPLEYLRLPEAPTYILVTNAQANRDLAPHRIRRLDEAPTATALPFASKLPAEEQTRTASRLGIFDQRTPEVVRGEIQRLLREAARVPSSRAGPCQNALEEGVRLRLLGRAPKDWSRKELHRQLRQFDGLPLNPHEDFVPPSVYEMLKSQLDQKYALILLGQPGVGKSTTAEVLAYEHRARPDPFEIVRQHGGMKATVIRDYLQRPGKHLFYLEDPWGTASPSPDADHWRNELPYLLPQAGPDKLFLITSRVGLFKGPGPFEPEEPLQQVAVHLLPEHYTVADRRRILRAVLRGDPHAEDLASIYEAKILSTLEVPFSLHSFGKRLRGRQSLRAAQLDELLQEFLMTGIPRTVAQEVRSSSPEHLQAAALLGVLFRIRRPCSFEEVEVATHALRRAGLQRFELDATLQQLVRAGWVEKRAEGYWAHPQVVEGLASLYSVAPEAVSDALLAWLDGLIKEQYLGTAFLLTYELLERKIPLSAETADRLDQLLIEWAQDQSDAHFPDAFELLGTHSRGNAPEALVARLLVGPDGFSVQRRPEVWAPRELRENERASISESRSARSLVARFLRFGWMRATKAYYWHSLSSWLQSFGWDFSAELSAAAKEALGETGWQILDKETPSYINKETPSYIDAPFACALCQLLEGALSYTRAPWEELLELSLDALARASAHWSAASTALDRSGLSGIATQRRRRRHYRLLEPYDRALATIVDLRRKREGHTWVLAHPRRHEIVHAFEHSIRAAAWVFTTFLSRHDAELRPKVTLTELLALREASAPDDRHQRWWLYRVMDSPKLVPCLLEDMRACPLDRLSHGMEVLHSLCTEPELSQALRSLAEACEFTRRVVLAEVGRGKDYGTPLEGLSAREQEVVECALGAIQQQPEPSALQRLDPEQRDWLHQLNQQHPSVLGLGAMLFLASFGTPLDARARTTKAFAFDSLRNQALSILFERKLPGAREWVRAHLQHESAPVRISTVRLLAPTATEEERQLILQLANDDSIVVRKECALQIAEHGWMEGVETLFALLSTPSFETREDRYYTQEVPVARVAASSLTSLRHLSARDVQRCITFVKRGPEVSLDPSVRCELLPIVTNSPTEEAREALEQCLGSSEALWDLGNSWVFPVRCAGARALFAHVRKYPAARERVDLEGVLREAGSPDGRRAGPALLLTGLLAYRAPQRLRELLTASTMSSRRALLLMAGALFSHRPFPEEWVRSHVSKPEDMPGFQLLKHAEPGGLPAEAWENLMHREPETLQWLDTLREDKDINRTLRWACFELSGRQAHEALGMED